MMRFRSLLFLVAIGLAGAVLSAAPADSTGGTIIPLKNWLPALWNGAAEDESQEKIGGMALPSTASHFIALNPCRVADTRNANGPHGGPAMVGGVPRVFNMTTSACAGVPVAAAYSLNIAVTGSPAGSIHFLSAYPAGSVRPLVATMNFDGGETTSNAALVPADALGAIEFYTTTNGHLIIDINGYIKEGVVTSVAAGTGMSGGGTGAVTVGIANSGVGTSQIADAAVNTAKIANSTVVRSIEGLRDVVDIAGTGGATVSTAGGTITINTSAVMAPTGSVVLGETGDTTIVNGGYTEIGPSGLDDWRPTTSIGAPSARHFHTAVWTGTRMIIWGGTNSGGPGNNGGQYDPVANSWTVTTQGTNVPSARYHHTAVWTGSRMIVWGGITGAGTHLGDGGIYDPTANTWATIQSFGAPAARSQHSAVFTATVMIIWGGINSGGRLNTGSRYNVSGNAWADTTVTGAPTARTEHIAGEDDYMLIWGGFDGANRLSSGARYDAGADVWLATPATGAPSARSRHAAVATGFGTDDIVIWGGYNGASYLNSGARYDEETNSFVSVPTLGAPSGRADHPMVYMGNGLIAVWGGRDSTGALDTGGVYDFINDLWVKAPNLIGAPTARLNHTAVWTGKRMIVWGGTSAVGTGYLNSGGQWVQFVLYQKN